MEGPGIESYADRNTMSRGSSEQSYTLGLIATIHATLPLVTALARGAGVSRTGLETEAIVKEKCNDLIQCQALWRHTNKAQNISLHEP